MSEEVVLSDLDIQILARFAAGPGWRLERREFSAPARARFPRLLRLHLLSLVYSSSPYQLLHLTEAGLAALERMQGAQGQQEDGRGGCS